MKLKKILALVLSICSVSVCAFSTVGCKKKAKYNIGVCQLVQHEALDAATKGFKDYLKEKLGKDVSFDIQVAAGDSTNCSTIVNGFVSSKCDLIMANATAALQAAASATEKIPVLGTSITDYGSALDITDFDGIVGTNVSGTSDLAPLDEQAAMIKQLYPEASKVGILYCNSEPNSKFQSDKIKTYLQGYGYTVSVYTFNDTNDVTSVTTNCANNCDLIFIPTDNTAANNTEAIANVVIPERIPVFCGEEGICKGCGIYTLSISYYELGRKTGEMAYEILVNGANVSEMEIQYDPNPVKKYNATNFVAFYGASAVVPDGFVAIV